MRLTVVLLAALFMTTAYADPPYSVTATFTAPVVDATHGAADGYRLYQGCQAGETKTLVGTVASGQTFTGLLTAQGTYSFCVHAFNTAGEGPRSNIQVVNINDFAPAPGAPTNLQVTVTCDASCTVTITNQP